MNFTIRQRYKIPQFIFRMFKNHPENGNWWGHYWKHPKDRIATTRSGNSWPSDMLTEVNRAHHYGCPALLLGDHSLYYCTIYRISVSSTVCLPHTICPGCCRGCPTLTSTICTVKTWARRGFYKDIDQSLNPSRAYIGFWLMHVRWTLLVGGQFGNLLADCLDEQETLLVIQCIRGCWVSALRLESGVCGCLLWWPVGRKLEGIKVGNICRYCSAPSPLCPWPHFFRAPVAFISRAHPELATVATQGRPWLRAALGTWKNLEPFNV